MDIEELRQAAIDKRFILSANPDWREGRACGLTDDKTEQKANDALTIILDNIEELVVAYLIDSRQSVKSDIGETSDGYHTFNELYEHRTALFATLCNMRSDISWKSMKHDDGTMYDGMFVAGIETPDGQYTYHCDMKYLYMFAYTPEVDKAPPYDGHQPKDYPRLLGLSESSLYR